ncbi:uncharacterized protein F4807DRAFT_457594 [Annulohypoxylon truncatum]|uniref:uncharacterized protein n=1 Tax=Annulohypoxylon truncatum TaxID=327061 RepID=UPI002007D758|nr:uncharacterized protein F4807DRAFT_457594 [Annulohypoxylon truncatum]KAI1212796.1 hypothetical protein F4807DRAFT_457594 [Annulohypoxylon truncatum]
MDSHPSGQPRRGSRWTNSRLSRRVPLSPEGSDGSDSGGVGGGASVHSRPSSKASSKSKPSAVKNKVDDNKSSIASAHSSPHSDSSGKTIKAAAPKPVSGNEVKPSASSMNADKAIGDGKTPVRATMTSATPLSADNSSQPVASGHNLNPFSESFLRAHMAHRSMDVANSPSSNNMQAYSSGSGPESFSGTAHSVHHGINRSLDFAMTGKKAQPDQKVLVTAMEGLAQKGPSTDNRSGITRTPNSSPATSFVPNQAASKDHARRESNSTRSVDSPEVASMLFQKLSDSARGVSINSTSPTPGFGPETRISLGLENRSPPGFIRSTPETEHGKEKRKEVSRAYGPRKPSPLNSVMNSSDEEEGDGKSTKSQHGGSTTPTPTPRGRNNTLPATNARQQQHPRAHSLTVEGRTNDMTGSAQPNSEGLTVDQYAHGLPGSASTGALTERISAPMQPPRLSARSCSPQQHQEGPGSLAVVRRPVVPLVGPLEFDPVPEDIWHARSPMLNQLTGFEGRPSLRDILHPWYVPFSERCRFVAQSIAGVICISNVPYEVSRAEVIAFLGRSANILNDRDEPVHIIMDRTTSKTNECYVEFASFEDAVTAVTRYQNAVENGTHVPKIGTRNVDVAISSQATLMKNLFPLAKGVQWEEVPFRITRDSPHDWDNFKGFITQEEMTLLCKHVEGYNNPVFAKKCPERPYECLISTIKKYPWHMSEHVTIRERGYLYDAGLKMIGQLQKRIGKGDKPDRLTPQLLNRLAETMVSSPGFSAAQKDNIAYQANMPEYKLRDMGQPRFAGLWRHLLVINIKEGVPLDMVEYYISLIRDETTRIAGLQGISQQQRLLAEQATTSDYWGFF